MVSLIAKNFFLFLLISLVGCVDQNKKIGNSISYNIGGEPTTLSPLSASDGYTSNVHSYIFEALLDRDIETYDWKPALATEWEVDRKSVV